MSAPPRTRSLARTHAARRDAPPRVESARRPVRVAVYTRKSVAKGLEQEFNSIEAQRAAVEAYVASQAGSGWRVLPQRYDDGGYTGANTDRPALRRLLDDVDAGRVDVVAVYKIDRLSRSLLDFAQLTARLDARGVGLVSITQQFNTATSMGKLTLNILMSFAEFEREVIAERTADKIAATRRRGGWTGGRPVLGYDSVDAKLVVNAAEAERVRAIFQLYLDVGSMTGTLSVLRARGWTNKAWTNARGLRAGGSAFDEASLRRLLTNPLYAGRIRCGDEVVDAAHDAIVDAALFQAAQDLLAERRQTVARGGGGRTPWSSLLGGLVRCARCGTRMGHCWGARGARRYRYYACGRAQRHGARACPGSRVSAPELEEIVISRLRAIGEDPILLNEVARAADDAERRLRPGVEERLAAIESAGKSLAARREGLQAAIRDAGGDEDGDEDRAPEHRGPGRKDPTDREARELLDRQLAEVEAQIAANDAELQRAREDLRACDARSTVNPDDVRRALTAFGPVWDEIAPADQARIVHLLVERVTCDVGDGEVRINLSAEGARAIARTEGPGGEGAGAPREDNEGLRDGARS